MKKNKINTKRLILRKFTNKDIDDFVRIVGNDDIGKQLPKGKGYTRKEAQKWLKNIEKVWKEKNYGTWAVIQGNTGKLIGHCGLNPIDELEEVEVLYAIDPCYWGNGYATEAAKAAVKFAFEEIKLDKVIGLTKKGNIASEKVLQKTGLEFVKEINIFNMTCKLFERIR